MNVFRKSLVACAIAALAGTACASGTVQTSPQLRLMAMVVSVNRHGQVTGIQRPSEKLAEWEHRLLMNQLHAWFTKPATDKNGKPMSSHFILEVAMHAKPVGRGNYAVSFTYVRALPMPVYSDPGRNRPSPGAQMAEAQAKEKWNQAMSEWEARTTDGGMTLRRGVPPPSYAKH